MSTLYSAAVCEHEAAHGVVAAALGLTVAELRADLPDGGHCRFRACGLRAFEAAVATFAPAVWLGQFRRGRYPADLLDDGDDQQRVTRFAHQLGTPLDEAMLIRRAVETRAEQVLRERHDDVLTVASKLQRSGAWVAGRGYVRLAPLRPQLAPVLAWRAGLADQPLWRAAMERSQQMYGGDAA